MSTNGIIGKHAFYQGLDIYVFNERQGTYRVQVLDGSRIHCTVRSMDDDGGNLGRAA
jgi:hypothetical protein